MLHTTTDLIVHNNMTALPTLINIWSVFFYLFILFIAE